MTDGYAGPVSLPAQPEHPLRVLFVCTANIGRSAYAERRAVQLLAAAQVDSVSVASAGVAAGTGRAMDGQMAAQLRARGGDPYGHSSRPLTLDLLEEAHLVLTFEFGHRLRIASSWPTQEPKVFGFRQLADAVTRVQVPGRGLLLLDQAVAVGRRDGLNFNVADPYGRGPKVARACADIIDAGLNRILPLLPPD